MMHHTFDFSKARVLVLGDVMLDQYWQGPTARVSPEAPVPIVRIQEIEERPGGAANVAVGVAALGARVHLMGLVGTDAAADALLLLLNQPRITLSLQRIPHAQTIKKLRIMSRDQQIVRLDMEAPFVLSEQDRQLLEQHYRQALTDTDIVILSDYGKGTLADAPLWIEYAHAMGIPVVVDPKSSNFAHYRGASVIAPNMKEFEAVVGPCVDIEQMNHKAQALLGAHQIESMVITRSEQGLSIIRMDEPPIHIKTVARKVHDVTGAGDTVVAVLSTALAAGFDLIQAATLGNQGAGLVVAKLGASTVSVEELAQASYADQEWPLGIVEESVLLKLLAMCRMSGERIVFTNGCFDLLHAGHVMVLEEAKALGDRLIVAVNSDDSVSRLKGPKRPVNPLSERMTVLAALRAVDWVIAFSEDTPERLIQALSPDVLAKGGDYQQAHLLPGAEHVLGQGGSVRLLAFKEGCSTTAIIEKMS